MARMVFDPETGQMIDEYTLYFKKKKAADAAKNAMSSGGITDESGAIPAGQVESGKMSQEDFMKKSYEEGGLNEGLNKSTTSTDLTNSGMAAGQTAIQGGNIEDVAAAGLMAAPHPAAKAAGLGLMALSSVNKQKQQNKINKYNAEVARIKARQEAINRMAQIGQSLRV